LFPLLEYYQQFQMGLHVLGNQWEDLYIWEKLQLENHGENQWHKFSLTVGNTVGTINRELNDNPGTSDGLIPGGNRSRSADISIS